MCEGAGNARYRPQTAVAEPFQLGAKYYLDGQEVSYGDYFDAIRKSTAPGRKSMSEIIQESIESRSK